MDNWLTRIDQTTDDFLNKFGSLSSDELNWKASADTWSIAQNIEHLIVINESYYPTFEQLRKGTYQLPWMARWKFLVNFLGDTVLKAVQADRKKKIKTFEIWKPSQSNINDDILPRFQKHQAELKEWIKNSADLIKKGTVISSPANRNIVYKLETAFEIIVTHEQRHFAQACEVFALR
ncbi:MAG: DinB family protein [Microscillaceae bacterium]|jgi:hypothetical protein|nr:DinB family protein [Microscillaceae bacterium]